MDTIINSVFGLLLALGILVTVHEYGHFWVARKFGVKVLRFSIGFGNPIWTRVDRHGTEFAIAWIPLGGYVKMLDEREGDVPADQLSQAFTQKSPLQKIAIALAGPVANLIFAVVAFALMNMIGVQDLIAQIDDPLPDSVTAEAGLQRGDIIRAVDGRSVNTFAELGLAVAGRVGDSGEITLNVERGTQPVTVQLPIENWLKSEQTPNPVLSLGLYPKLPFYPAEIGRVVPGGAAEAAGLQDGDLVIRANGEAVEDWQKWVEVIRANASQAVELEIQRGGQNLQVTVIPAESEQEGERYGYVGVERVMVEWDEDQLITSRYWPPEAVKRGFQDTFEMVTLSYQMLWKMVSGKVSLRQIGGPISMAQMAGVSVTSGLETFIGYLAFISISLAIVNLLPVPVLDGGHVLMHSIELVSRRPLSERAQIIGMQIGMGFIICLMLLAFFNDIGRIL